MSKQIDDRVVSLQFDNKNFESNVSTTMSTLDKLKAKLSFKGAEQGLNNISASASKVDMSGLSSGVEAVQAKFSALQVIGVTALANITNSAVNAGRRLVNAFTIQPITTGFNEYELKMGSIQTIMASTGESLEKVNGYLNELNEYSDKTIYSFSDMTQNIGKFTNAGVKLNDAVLAIKGVSNEAAVSGANANEASRAMYNFAQALSAGYVKLIDWKSIENANMATVEFKNELIKTAVELGTLTQVGDKYVSTTTDLYGKTSDAFNATRNFNESLSNQWMTTDVLVKTLGKYADETTDIGKKAFAAAQDVKTFSMMMDTLKETAQSGWAQTWEIIFGDFEEGKALWTSLTNIFSGLIEKVDDFRNSFLTKSFQTSQFDTKSWTKLTKTIDKAGVSVEDFKKELMTTAKTHGKNVDQMIEDNGSFEASLKEGWLTADFVTETLKRMSESTKETSKSQEDLNKKLETFQKVVDQVWNGDYKNGAERIKALTDAGYDYAKVQDLVNKTVDGHRLTLADLGEEQLKAIGYTDEEIKALKELAAQAEKSGTSLNKLIQDLNQRTGRELLGESFTHTHLWEELQKIFDEIGKAWEKVFPKNEEGTTWLYNAISSFHDAVMSISADKETLDNIAATFEGLFRVFELGVTILGGPLAILRKIIKICLNLLQLDFLGLTARIGKMITAFRNWLFTNNALAKSLLNAGNAILDWIDKIVKAIIKWFNSLGELPEVQKAWSTFVKVFTSLGDKLTEWFKGFTPIFDKFIEALKKMGDYDPELVGKAIRTLMSDIVKLFGNLPKMLFGEMFDVGNFTIEGLVQGIQNGIDKVVTIITDIADNIVKTIKAVLGIHSPSTVMIEVGKNIIEGLVEGLKSGISIIGDVVSTLWDFLKSLLSDVDFTDVVLVGTLVSVLLLARKLLNIFTLLAKPFEAVGGLIDGIKNIFNSFAKYIDAKALTVKAEAMYTIAKAIGILVVSMIALSLVPWQKLLKAGIALAGVVAALAIISVIAKKIKIGDLKNIGSLSIFMISLGASLLIISMAIKNIAKLDVGELNRSMGAIMMLMISIIGLLMAFSYLAKNDLFGQGMENASKLGTMFIKMAAAFAILALVMRIIAGMSPGEIAKGIAVLILFEALFAGVVLLSNKASLAKKVVGSGKAFMKFAKAILVLVLCVKLISYLSVGEIAKGIITIALLGGIFAGVIFLSGFAKTAAFAGADNAFMKFAIAIGVLALCVKLLGNLKYFEIMKGISAIAACSLLFYEMLMIAEETGDGASTAATTFLKFSAAIAVLAIAIKMIAGIALSDIVYGMGVMIAFTLLCKLLVKVSNSAGQYADKAGTMILKIAIAFGVLAIVMRLMRGLSLTDIGKGIAFLGGVMVIFYTLIKVSQFAGKYADKAGIMLMKMAIPITVLAASIGLLSLLDPAKVAIAAAVLSGVMVVFAACAALIFIVPKQVADKLVAILITLSVAVAIIGGVLYLIGQLPCENALAAGASLAMVMMSIALVLGIAGSIKGVSKSAIIGLYAIVGAVALIAVILGVMSYLNVTPSIETAMSISILLLAMAGVFGILALVGGMAPSAIAAAGAFDAVIVIIGSLLVGIGALMEYIPGVEKFLDKGISVLNKIGSAIGSFIGSIISGFTDAADLPKAAKQLSDFMASAQPFFDAINNLNVDALESVNDLVDAMQSLSSYAGGEIDFEAFKTDLTALGEALVAYSASVSDGSINVKAIEESAKAANAMIEVAKAIPNEGGWIGNIVGNNDMGKFAKKLSSFGEAMKSYSASVSGGAIDVGAIDDSSKAANAMVEVAKAIPNSGGLLGGIAGDNDIDTFGTKLEAFGESIVKYSESISNKTFNVEAIKESAKAARALVNVANAIPKDDGWFGKVFGDNNLDDFGEKLSSFGLSLSKYSASISVLDEAAIERIRLSAIAAKALAEMAAKLPEELPNLKAFSKGLDSIGPSLATYATSVAEVDCEKISNTASSIKSLVGAIKKMEGLSSSGAIAFTTSINTLATANVKGLVSAFSGETGSLASVGEDIAKSISSGISSGQSSVTTAIGDIMRAAVSGAEVLLSDFTDIGKSMASKMSTGIKDNSDKVASKAKSAAKGGADAVKEKYQNFYDAGKYLCQGMIDGIASKVNDVAAQAASMANSAAEAARAALVINSPSKVFRKIGMSVPEGFAQGIGKLGNLVLGSSEGMADNALNSTKKAISRIASIIDSDIDAQPTIRPVVDLSNVSTGVSAINGMLSMSPSVGVLANVNGISASMNRRSQNGTNDDVVSAINGLKKTIADSNGNTYNVNGVTYDDGSNVSDAVKALVRAAKIERRS